MATAQPQLFRAGDHRFFLITSMIMALVIVLGFSTQLIMGRSTFAAPVLVHVHAIVFFGWTAFYVLQNALVATGSTGLHRRLGWIGAGWAAVVVALGIYTTSVMVRRGAAPFFFEPNFFLFMNSLSVLGFGGLVATAIRMRRKTAWHRRLMLCGMAILTGPAFGRLLPMPLMIPWAAWGVFAAIMLFPLAGIIADLRRNGSVHPAWWWGVATMALLQAAMGPLAHSGAGLAIYRAVTNGASGASVDPLAYPAPPF